MSVLFMVDLKLSDNFLDREKVLLLFILITYSDYNLISRGYHHLQKESQGT